MNLRRIVFILGFVLAITLMAMAYGFLEVQNQSTKIADGYEQAAQERELAIEAYITDDDLTRAVQHFIITGNPRFLTQYYQILAIRDGKLERPVEYPHLYWGLRLGNIQNPLPGSGNTASIFEMYERVGFLPNEIAYLQTMYDNSTELSKIEIRAANAAQGLYPDADGNFSVIGFPDQKAAIEAVFGDEYLKKKNEIYLPLLEMSTVVYQRMDKIINDGKAAQQTALLVFTVFLLAALVEIIAIALLTREINRRELAQRSRAQQQAEQENEELNNSVIDILTAVNQLSQRDLTVRAPVTEDIIGTVSDSINLLSAETARVLLGVTDIAEQVAGVSNNLRNQADTVNVTAQAERQSVQNAIESLLDATQTMNQVAALAEQSNSSAAQVTDATNKALETVQSTVSGMEQIRETIAESEKRIKRLGERSQEISGIVNLINTISERTHVLALNASMQAAVAGEAGRGFAVVAEEVQRLAESSRNATEQIATLVTNIQLETNETINTVNNTISQVVEGSKQAQEAGEQMRLTQSITEDLVSQVGRITLASEKQKEMSADLLAAVQAIGQSAEQTALQIEAANEQSHILQDSANQLVSSVNVFKLPEPQSL